MNYEILERLACAAGFERCAPLKVDTIVLHPEVREMCASRRCTRYGHSWSCPPHVGSLEACRARIARYREGILVQTVQEIEDSFDGEGMMKAERLHKERFYTLQDQIAALDPEHLAISAGSCTRCKECSCPDAPCRFPEKAVSSMEAYGMLVLEVCKVNGLNYYYGSNKIAYTSCFLLI